MKHLVFTLLLLSLITMGCGSGGSDDNFVSSPGIFSVLPSQSSTVQIHPNDQVVYNLNFENDSMTATRVRFNGLDDATVLGEIPVGNEPRSISINPSGTRAYISNAADNTVTVVGLGGGFGPYFIVATISVGSEPRGTALSPSGSTLYVANYSDGTVSVIDTSTLTLVGTVSLGANSHPYAVAVTNDGDGFDSDEKVYVTEFFASARPGFATDTIEGFDDGKEGRVRVLDAGSAALIGTIALTPKLSGFSADQSGFCTANGAVNDTFCGSASEPSSTFPNQLHSLIINPDSNRIYVPSIAASPEPPVAFNNNVQSLVSVIDSSTDTEVDSEAVNLNSQITAETTGAGLARAFAADTIAGAVRNGTFIFISRAGSYAVEASLDGSNTLSIGAPATVRYQTGNIPNGVAMSSDGSRAYVNAEVDATLTILDTASNAVLTEVATSNLPSPGSEEHNILLGKLVFYTGLGVPPDLEGLDSRSINTTNFRGLASDNNWSSCASCHPDGLADGVTWIFPTGPRQSVPLDASYSPTTANDQRVFNWNAVRGSVTDFNNNSRNIQGGIGHTPLGDLDAGQIFNHGPNTGVSGALDLMTLWAQAGICVLNRPSTVNLAAASRGRTLFATNCASCHGGPKWTSSQVRWAYPLFDANPLAGGNNLNPQVSNMGPIILSFTDPDSGAVIPNIQNAGTLDLTNPIEIRGGGGMATQASVGLAGSFNPPSLLNVNNTPPYGHHGRAQTLSEVFTSIAGGGLGHADFGLSAADLADIVEFMRTIDGTEPPF